MIQAWLNDSMPFTSILLFPELDHYCHELDFIPMMPATWASTIDPQDVQQGCKLWSWQFFLKCSFGRFLETEKLGSWCQLCHAGCLSQTWIPGFMPNRRNLEVHSMKKMLSKWSLKSRNFQGSLIINHLYDIINLLLYIIMKYSEVK